jgi:hypothetical protein
LGIQRSNVTHILDGRNKPSLSFIEKLMAKFPQVNIEWLLNGTGEMYKQNNASPTLFSESGATPQNPNPQPAQGSKKSTSPKQEFRRRMSPSPSVPREPESPVPESTGKANSVPKTEPPTLPSQPPSAGPDLTDKCKEQDIESVMVFYADKTFKLYHPS